MHGDGLKRWRSAERKRLVGEIQKVVLDLLSELRRFDQSKRDSGRYGGELLPGYYEPWVLTERERLAEAYVTALRQLAAARASLAFFMAAPDAASPKQPSPVCRSTCACCAPCIRTGGAARTQGRPCTSTAANCWPSAATAGFCACSR